MPGTSSDPYPVAAVAGAKANRDGVPRTGDVRRWLGMNGDALGTDGTERSTFLYGLAAAAALVATINAMNVISESRDAAGAGLLASVIWEGSSWLTVMAFFWVPWAAYRLAPPAVRPRWRLLVHMPAALLFALGHVSGFIGLRKLAYAMVGWHYRVDGFWTDFGYELRKDVIGYALFIVGLAFIGHLLRLQQAIVPPVPSSPTFDIRDGARLNRVRLEEVLAINSAGNYVEFLLRDGRRLMMRSPLSALEETLGPSGFVRTHRSWLVNTMRVTGLTPEGSGDYAVSIDNLTVPLSRRFPEALARLKVPASTADR
jgi:hypothetical protein